MIHWEYNLAVTLISGVLAFGLGMFWYSEKAMGKRWLEARGKTDSAAKPAVFKIVFPLLLWLLAACFYTFLVAIIRIDEVAGFFCLSCLLWVAFAMPPLVMGALYTGYAFEAVSIDASYQLAGYYVFAIVHILMKQLVM